MKPGGGEEQALWQRKRSAFVGAVPAWLCLWTVPLGRSGRRRAAKGCAQTVQCL